MTETYDLIAINERGVYAICSDQAGEAYVAEFIREALCDGSRIERVTTKDACERHLLYLAALPSFAGLIAPSQT